ncbi:hypothetical protein [Bacillus horti]|uniref:Tissue inhibitor of metalloproteinase n=1 Tax=Caldalkalibacillus horti TaxID=77523 RepID=A0ABT9VW86_9BACI|nr:hypothetical protein [Bacillus horti]MDQ0165261.1 hypothetical protein [Bacillus horti]
MKKTRKLLLILSVATLIFTFNPNSTSACSCAEPRPVEEALEERTAVFSGKVKDIYIANKGLTLSSVDPVMVTLDVYEVWKGDVPQTVIIETVRFTASCGYDFSVGEEYIVFAYGEPDALKTGLCERTKPLDAASEELAVLGEGKRPEPLDIDSNNSMERSAIQETENRAFIRSGQYITTAILVLSILVIRRIGYKP